ncbi:MAG TPA: TIGR04372 family glycosyltransferase [Gammaproteobacteria bacterium]|nr:TIGR04372 family glycosyltransferase [Gammaproteobacteria bacterium]
MDLLNIRKDLKEHSYLFVTRFILKTIYYKLIRIFIFPIAIFIACLRPWMRIRFIPLSCLTIGHYSLSIEVLLCKIDQDRDNKRKEIIIYLQKPKSEVCNLQLYKMWKRVLSIPPDVLYFVLIHVELYLEHWFGIHQYKMILGQASHDRWDVLETSKQHLHFTKEELLQGENILVNMGIPKNLKYICLLVRDEAYYLNNATYSKMSAYKNSDIATYKKAALFLANNGYYVIRMGKFVKKSFDVKHDKIIDYANSAFRSDFMDIYLSSHCYFFMSTLCGLDGVAHAFRRPILATNVTPIGYFDLGYPVKVFLSKKIINSRGDVLTFEKQNEIFNVVSNELFNKMLNDYALTLIDNTEDEILEVTKEMVLRMQEKWCDTGSSLEVQKRFWSIMPKNKFYLNGDGTLRIMPKCQYEARYCTDDLLKNRALLEDERVIVSVPRQTHVAIDEDK